MSLDWKAYFIEFCRVHGEPVEHEGRLLFRDGWTYSRTDYQGPEWPPPADHAELDGLVRRYWQLRLSTVKTALENLLAKRKELTDLKAVKSLPLQQVTTDPEGRRAYKRLDTAGLDTRIGWLAEDVAECETRLTELAKHGTGATG